MPRCPFTLLDALCARRTVSRAGLAVLLMVLGMVGARAADQPRSELLREALAAAARFDSRTALDLYLQADAAQPDDPATLQEISRQYSDLTIDEANVAEKKRLSAEALKYSQRAVELQPDNPLNLVSLAICYAKLGALSDARTHVEYSRLVRDYAERALALDPDYAYAHHVLGRWHYEVASLDAASRLMIRMVYGGLPPARTAEAVSHLQRAVELEPDVPGHRLELGFALLADGQRSAARAALEQGLALPQREKYESESRARARAALQKMGPD